MLPFMNPTNKKSKKYVVAFKGLNYGEGYEDGEFSATEGVSTNEFPCLTQRSSRVFETFNGAIDAETSGKPRYLVSTMKGMFYIAERDPTNANDYAYSLYCNGERTGLEFEHRTGCQLACIGNYIVIFPHKVYYNIETKEYGSMDVVFEADATITDSTITITDGKFPFEKGDTIKISGSNKGENNRSATIREYEEMKLTFDANTFQGDTAKITIERTVPELEYICESNYRLWGVKGNTIYGSKYSDPMNFQSFDGSSADSYAIEVGTDGKFTGCIPYTSHICFFKENMLHKLYGSKPANFQLVNSQVYGVQEGSERSMSIINEVLYYKGVNGVYAYTGGVPELVSSKFGMESFHSALAASDGRRYYIAMRNKRNPERGGLYVYDTATRLWVRECNSEFFDVVFHDGNIYYTTAGKPRGPWRIDNAADRSDIDWSVTFCPFNEVMNERKGYSKFHMRLDLSEGASLLVEVKRNTDTQWKEVKTISNSRAQTVTVPILPARCDSVEIRLSGRGVCKLRTFIREFYVGSDV